jgi:hypothetical protein
MPQGESDMHHSDEMKDMQQLEELLAKETERLELGATGQFPLGKLTDGDEGELRFGVTSARGKVIINFGKPVAYIGMTKEQARELAETILKHAEKSRPPAPMGKYR